MAMTIESESAFDAIARHPWVVAVRLAIAWLLTVSALPLGLGIALVFFVMFNGRIEASTYRWFLPAVLGVVLLTWGLGASTGLKKKSATVMLFVFLSWFLATGVLGYLRVNSPIERAPIIAFYAAATLWMPWLAWIGFMPFAWLYRIVMLALLTSLLFVFHHFVELTELSGAALLNLNWRDNRATVAFASDLAGEAVSITVTPTENDFPQYLGPRRDGIVRDVKLDENWEARPPEILWSVHVGSGWSSAALVGGYAFTQEQRDDQECVVCYDLKTGKQAWIHKDDTGFFSKAGGDGPRATPTVLNGFVYTVGATGIVNCLEASTGKRVWKYEMLESPGDNLTHGVCGSPLVLGDVVYVCPVAKDEASFAALESRTGRVIYTAGGGRAAYSSPTLVEIAGVFQILTFNAEQLASHDLKTGDVLWTYTWKNDSGVNASQPILYRPGKEFVFISTAYGIGAAMLDVSQLPDGQWSVERAWKSIKMKNKFTSSVLVGDMIVGLDEEILSAIDAKTGNLLWKLRRFGHGQILMVGEHILVLSEQGELWLVKPSREEGTILAGPVAVLHNKTWNNLAFSKPYLFVRNSEEAVCVRLPLVEDSESAAPVSSSEKLDPAWPLDPPAPREKPTTPVEKDPLPPASEEKEPTTPVTPPVTPAKPAPALDDLDPLLPEPPPLKP